MKRFRRGKFVLLSLAALSIVISTPAVGKSERFVNLAIVFPLVSPKISSKYGSRRHPIFKTLRHHNGVDLQAPLNSHVRTIMKGVVVFADTYAGYGKLVTIRHQDGYYSMYGHLNELLVNPGQIVATGDLIGRVGSSGNSTGPHLHFEWRKNGTPLNPLDVFPALALDAAG